MGFKKNGKYRPTERARAMPSGNISFIPSGRQRESYGYNHHFCNMCGTVIDDLYNKNKSRKLCDPCKDWKKSPHPSWND